MTKPILALGALALAIAATSASAETAAEKGDAKFAELTEGRVAGEARTCITAIRSRGIEVVENLGVTYEDGDTLWIARARDPRSLSRDDVPIWDRFGSQICSNDMIRTIDRNSYFITGSVFLDDFVPYAKVETEEG